MRDSNGEIVRAGDTIESSYGIPPVRVRGVIYLDEKRHRLLVRTDHETMKDVYLADFKRWLGDFYLVKRRIER